MNIHHRSRVAMAGMLMAVLIIALALPAQAQLFRSTAKVGTTAAQFLKIGVGARAIGMGGAQTGVTGDISAIYWNPAALSRMNINSELMFNHVKWLADINFDFAAGVIADRRTRHVRPLDYIAAGSRRHRSRGGLPGRETAASGTPVPSRSDFPTPVISPTDFPSASRRIYTRGRLERKRQRLRDRRRHSLPHRDPRPQYRCFDLQLRHKDAPRRTRPAVQLRSRQ